MADWLLLFSTYITILSLIDRLFLFRHTYFCRGSDYPIESLVALSDQSYWYSPWALIFYTFIVYCLEVSWRTFLHVSKTYFCRGSSLSDCPIESLGFLSDQSLVLVALESNLVCSPVFWSLIFLSDQSLVLVSGAKLTLLSCLFEMFCDVNARFWSV